MSTISKCPPDNNWNFAELRKPISESTTTAITVGIAVATAVGAIAAIAVGIVVATAVGAIAASGKLSLHIILTLAAIGGMAGFAGYTGISHLVNRLNEYKNICMTTGMIDSSSAPHMDVYISF